MNCISGNSLTVCSKCAAGYALYISGGTSICV
jgi:hypothetical protein